MKRAILQTSIGALVVALAAGPGLAQSDPGGRARAEIGVDDIIVTARKRDETSIAVPLAITAVGAAELSRRGITKLDELGKAVPQLQIGESNGGVQGGTITMRGIGSGDSNGLVEQAVSFVIDGAPVQRASIRRMSELDIQQIEVLKGPQALFFGKNSPGGIISIRTADPTPELAGKLSASYGFSVREAKTDGFLAGPITDTFGARVAFYGSMLNGGFRNMVPASNPLRQHARLGRDREYGGRLTLKWEPTPEFMARFKFNYGHTRTAGLLENAQYIFCSGPSPQYVPGAECVADGRSYYLNTGTAPTARNYRYGNGVNSLKQKQILTSLELTYEPVDSITLTSLTSLYDVKFDYNDNITPGFSLYVSADAKIRDFSHEVRAVTSFDGPLNFTVGGYYATSRGNVATDVEVVAARSAAQNNIIKSQAYSGFAQGTLAIADTIELAGGARYSHETKKARTFFGRDPGIYDIPFLIDPTKRSFSNISPEATLTWRPSQALTVYGGYRQGFLSGGFSAAVSTALNRSFDQQKTKGFEAGLKALLFDNSLRFNLAAYRYVTTGLQVSVGFTSIVNGLPVSVLRTLNAGKATTKGVEADFSWKSPVEGLSINGALSYLNARYNTFSVLCYRGQTPAEGCNLVNNTAQDLSGQPVVRAPDWTGNIGATYETALSGPLKLSFSGDASYSDQFFTESRNMPGSLQDSYWLFDAGVRLINDEQGWQLGLLGKNLTNEYFVVRTSEATSSGTAPGVSPGIDADLIGSVNRGREIILQATIKFGAR